MHASVLYSLILCNAESHVMCYVTLITLCWAKLYNAKLSSVIRCERSGILRRKEIKT
jgi:hypothetical protein